MFRVSLQDALVVKEFSVLKRTKCGKFVTSKGFDTHVKSCVVCGRRDLSDIETPIRRMYYSEELATGKTTGYNQTTPGVEVNTENEANLISSLTVNNTHAPVIDLDLPVRLLPSRTPGHYHLYIDVEMDSSDYFELLMVMSKVGLVEEGYYEASRRKGASYVRTQEMAIRDALAK